MNLRGVLGIEYFSFQCAQALILSPLILMVVMWFINKSIMFMVIMDILRYRDFLRDHACKHEFWSMLLKKQHDIKCVSACICLTI